MGMRLSASGSPSSGVAAPATLKYRRHTDRTPYAASASTVSHSPTTFVWPYGDSGSRCVFSSTNAISGEPYVDADEEKTKRRTPAAVLTVLIILMMVILIWLQTGFAMVLLSAAIKGVPEDTIEAARIDGASELQIFWQVVIPQIWATIITVFITVLILVLKVFDIVYVLTNGRDNSDVIANMFFNEMFARGQAGRATAIVVVLLLAVIPILIYQVKQFREQEAMR